ncbi:MAG: hypothetical protein Q7T58_05435 [Methylotenera sp.]|nr:hypothetical protein [Methylotenera sp.]
MNPKVITTVRVDVVKILLVVLLMITSSACANQKIWVAPPVLAQSASMDLVC